MLNNFLFFFLQKITFNISFSNNNQVIIVIAKSNLNIFNIPLTAFSKNDSTNSANPNFVYIKGLSLEDVEKLVQMFDKFKLGVSAMKSLKMRISPSESECKGESYLNGMKIVSTVNGEGLFTIQAEDSTEKANYFNQLVKNKDVYEVMKCISTMKL